MRVRRPNHGLPPLRRFGQHFLVDRAVLQRIGDAVAPAPGEALLEIGPGDGALTEFLLRAGRPMAAVEIDRGRAALLRRRFDGTPLVVIEANVLDLDLSTVAARCGLPDGAPLVVAGNLPYNISKPVAMRIVGAREQVCRAVLMFQREVADRIVALPGTRAYGPLAILAGLGFRIERLFDVPPGAFRPRPEVISSVTRWLRRDDGHLSPALEGTLRLVLRACFRRRRATVRRNLRDLFEDDTVRELLLGAGIEPEVRAERLEASAFLRLAERWPGAKPG